MRTDMLERALDEYRKEAEGSLAERLRFLEGLVKIQADIAAVDRPYGLPDTDTGREALLTGQPLFLSAPPVLPHDAFEAAVERIAAYVAEEAGLSEAQAAALRHADFAGALTEERLRALTSSSGPAVAQVAAAVGASDDVDLKPVTVAYVLTSALVPFLTGPAAAAVESLGGLDKQSWTQGTCPVCGSPAAMGMMGESTKLQGGERTLWCGLCHTEWAYDRLRCVRCGTHATDKLRYVHIEGDPAHRLHLCDECKGYVRIVFEGELGKPVSMVVEDAVTAVLDAVALDEGYSADGEGTTFGE